MGAGRMTTRCDKGRRAHRRRSLGLAVAGAGMLGAAVCFAGPAHIVKVEVVSESSSRYTVHTTIRHADTGWDHYADAWRVLTVDGRELGKRVLFHPHVNEQPFTRSLSGVKVPEGVDTIVIEAHDKVHGANSDRVTVDLTRSKGERYVVKRR